MKHEETKGSRASACQPSNSEIEREKDPIRKEILAAMQRILLGHPKYVPPGANSVSNLAKEAKVARHNLYQGHSDLRDRYEYLRDRADQPTEREAEIRRVLETTKAEITKIRDLQSRTRREADDWKALSELLARAINTLQEEIHQQQIRAERLARRLRRVEKQAGQASTVVMMHRRTGDKNDMRAPTGPDGLSD
jgi:chromosome segregation ATPase